MQNTVYSSAEHKSIVEVYITLCKQFVEDVSTKSRYKAYLDVLQTIIEYHNGYGEGVRENNFYDWITILPINISVMTNGYFAGMQTNKNLAVIRAYKVVLEQMLHETVSKLDKLEPTNE
jgi:hypothetical protein